MVDIKEILSWMWAAVLGLGSIVWKSQSDKIKDLERNVTQLQRDTLSKTDLREHTEAERIIQGQIYQSIQEQTGLINEMEKRSSDRHAALLLLLIKRRTGE